MSRKDFHVTIRLRNNHLYSRRKDLGFTQAQMAQACGISQQQWGEYERLVRPPVADGHWRNDAMEIANFCNADPSELWPDAILQVKQTVASRELSASDVAALGGADANVDRRRLQESVAQVVSDLPPREQEALVRRMGLRGHHEHTYGEIGEAMGISRERVRQIEGSALRHLRYPSRSKVLKPYVAEQPGEPRYYLIRLPTRRAAWAWALRAGFDVALAHNDLVLSEGDSPRGRVLTTPTGAPAFAIIPAVHSPAIRAAVGDRPTVTKKDADATADSARSAREALKSVARGRVPRYGDGVTGALAERLLTARFEGGRRQLVVAEAGRAEIRDSFEALSHPSESQE